MGAGELRPLVLLPADVWLVREGVQRDMGGAGEPPGVGLSPGWEGRFGGGSGRTEGGRYLRREPPGKEGEEERPGEAWGGHRSAGMSLINDTKMVGDGSLESSCSSPISLATC